MAQTIPIYLATLKPLNRLCSSLSFCRLTMIWFTCILLRVGLADNFRQVYGAGINACAVGMRQVSMHVIVGHQDGVLIRRGNLRCSWLRGCCVLSLGTLNRVCLDHRVESYLILARSTTLSLDWKLYLRGRRNRLLYLLLLWWGLRCLLSLLDFLLFYDALSLGIFI